MSAVLLTHMVLMSSDAVPPQLSSIMSPSQWAAIRATYNRAKNDACCYVCAGEWLCCLLFSFPCIFCCHPCFENLLIRDLLRNEAATVNRAYFGGKFVVEPVPDGILIHTATLNTYNAEQQGLATPIVYAPQGGNYTAAPQNYNAPPPTQYVPAGGAYYSGPPPTGQQYGTVPIVEAVPVSAYNEPVKQPQPQVTQTAKSMMVKIPPQVQAGAILTVMTPEGSTIQITVPPGVVPGQDITVQY
eukprot:gene15964-21664_t